MAITTINCDGHDCDSWAINDLHITAQRECNDPTVGISFTLTVKV